MPRLVKPDAHLAAFRAGLRLGLAAAREIFAHVPLADRDGPARILAELARQARANQREEYR